MNNEKIRITIIGDSISQGLGKEKMNYCSSLKKQVEKLTNRECVITNLAITGKTILYANEILSKIRESQPDVILLFLGSVDALVRPKQEGIWNLLPARYKLNGMLDPRPFYSKKKWKSFFQHIDSWIRWHLKIILLKTVGTFSWVDEDNFKKNYEMFINQFCDKKMLAVSPVYVDEKYFPGSNQNLKKYRSIISEVCSKKKNLYFFDIYSQQEKLKWKDKSIYGDDHFHPSKYGYEWMGKILGEQISDIMKG